MRKRETEKGGGEERKRVRDERESERRKGEREKDERQVGDYGKKIIREGIEIPTDKKIDVDNDTKHGS